jgi:prostaglandin-endoperoxide synthase 2
LTAGYLARGAFDAARLGSRPVNAGATEGARMRTLSDIKLDLANRIESWLTTNLPGVWKTIERYPAVYRRVNAVLIDRAILKIPTRPNPLSTLADYTSWRSLTDRSYDSRHLPPVEAPPADLPQAEAVAGLFNRQGEMTPCQKSTVLFPYFAEWFVDGFLRSERPHPDPATGEPVRDPARNESNHEIDLIQIYGLNDAVTRQLRSFEGGLLLTQTINGEEYPPYLFDGDRKKFDRVTVVRDAQITPAQRRQLFAFGSDTGNLQIGFVMMGVLFVREHNRIARSLSRANPSWNDERLFQTARNILTVILIKIVVEEYINHISPYHLKLLADPTGFRNPRWYRQNWMSIEFNLLYRWHSLVPVSFRIGGRDVAVKDTLFNTDTVIEHGLGACFEDASNQRAGRVGLFNSPPEVWDAELASVRQSRAVARRPYNDYRRLARFPKARRFEDISDDRRVQQGLRELYGNVDEIEFYPGLFAEDVRPNAVLPSLIGRMVAIDAFSQAFTNPLLSPRVFNPQTFSPLGWGLIRTTRTLSDLLHRNIPDTRRRYDVTMTRRDWVRT